MNEVYLRGKLVSVCTDSDGKAYVNQYVYENDLLTEVRHNTSADSADDVVYSFE